MVRAEGPVEAVVNTWMNLVKADVHHSLVYSTDSRAKLPCRPNSLTVYGDKMLTDALGIHRTEHRTDKRNFQQLM